MIQFFSIYKKRLLYKHIKFDNYSTRDILEWDIIWVRYSRVFGASNLRSVVTIRPLPLKSLSEASDARSIQKMYLATFDTFLIRSLKHVYAWQYFCLEWLTKFLVSCVLDYYQPMLFVIDLELEFEFEQQPLWGLVLNY